MFMDISAARDSVQSQTFHSKNSSPPGVFLTATTLAFLLQTSRISTPRAFKSSQVATAALKSRLSRTVSRVPSICSPPSLQIVDQLTILYAKLLAESIPLFLAACFLPQCDVGRNVVLGQRTLLGFAASRDDCALPAVNGLPQALVVVRGYSSCAPKRCRISSAVSKSWAGCVRYRCATSRWISSSEYSHTVLSPWP